MATCRILAFILLIYVNNAMASNSTPSAGECDLNTRCVNGVVLPTWGNPDEDVSTGIRVARAFVYLVLLMYFFLGVSIIADRFMSAIEIITSKEKDIRVTDKKTGKIRIVTVKIWNETVSNLTLMALGSSAPEILLTVIEVCGKNFQAGELGPSTIVGSAAFNLFVIIAICVYSIPCDDHRQIKHIQVFAVTASCSLFAYVWLYIIVAVSSPGVIEVWEGLLTFAFFPLLVLVAWGADRKFSFYRYLRKRVRRQKRQGVVVVQTGDYDVVAVKTKDGYSRNTELDGKVYDLENGELNGELDEEESELLSHDLTAERRQKAIQVIREIRQKNPNTDKETIDRILEQENLKAQPKSRAFYRIEATRKMVGSGSVLKAKHEKLEQAAAHSIADVDVEINELEEFERQHITHVQFDPPHHICVENCGNMLLTVIRSGGDDGNTVYVDFRTEDGTAKAGEDYEKTEGTLCFKPDEHVKTISVTIIDDDIFEEDEHFNVRLSNIRMAGSDGNTANYSGPAGVLGKHAIAEVVILDDDYPGVFSFEEESKTVPEADRLVVLSVVRHQGARGIVRVPYHTIEGTAKGGGEAFEDAVGELEFGNEEYSKQVEIVIVDDEDYEKRETFSVYLGEPYVVDENGEEPPPSPGGNSPEDERIRELGKPRLGEMSRVEVSIIESKEFKNTVDRLLAKANLALVVGTSSWREQFSDAFAVGSDDADDCESTEPSPPTYGDYLMHYLTLFWKVLFATVPPTDIWGGWASFWVSIIWVGILTMFIGDIASHFGCTIGLSDSVVAISFVALGTSVPDTFASKVAAVSDEYADSSIGNVTGSNSVNVFLGVGLAWSLAAIVHAIRGTEFQVEAGSLGFSVLIFCIFAMLAIFVLMLRRHPAVGGVLGGHMKYKLPTTMFLVFLWIMYIVLSSLEAYCHFEGF